MKKQVFDSLEEVFEAFGEDGVIPITSVSLVYLLPMWRKTFLDFDTYCNGKGSTVSNIIAG